MYKRERESSIEIHCFPLHLHDQMCCFFCLFSVVYFKNVNNFYVPISDSEKVSVCFCYALIIS